MEEHEKRPVGGKRLAPESRGGFWNNWGYLIVTVAVIVVLFKVIFQLSWVPSGSMETTIPTKSLLVGWRLPYLVSDPAPQRGSIVTFWDEEMGHVLVKRVVGLPGETVSFEGGFVYINGEKLDEDYLPVSGITQSEKDTFQVPEGCIFVMGDNRNHSSDSRSSDLGTVDTRYVIGRAVFLLFPGADETTGERDFGRIGGIDRIG